ncbi:hypothetical protein [Mucilaginibacter polytrichastri]|uniref:Beta-galactosidase trimerisation domain-containing protein n=1 Tax=Mucilaginibacter polytrichastri TaxID=1302689 RepID=A0A1Q6A3S8_9SPHI|nr:hypothetical protein [Mucilaginibacter polytrichastri]OKS88658.1 hypothetical protein RG47T_4130 [Mucilaginibacter polytrichastri]SFT26505.1 hypothetical protein SAMN04487890_12539 [Mucilaginibacter polytrichastri]
MRFQPGSSFLKILSKLIPVLGLASFYGIVQAQTIKHDTLSKTSVQIAEPWKPDFDVRSDIVMVYGVDSTFENRVASWRKHGYNVQFMTGSAWGEYQDYFNGKFDGKTHLNEGQTDIDGNIIWHGKDVPYVVPTPSYINYLKQACKRAIDAGVSAVYLEEPEFWTQGGYSPAFKSAWQAYYKSPWIAQDKSPEATYLSSKLKYQIFYTALNEIFKYVKEYSAQKGLHIPCFVPTHSLLNYAAWGIVSPEASLASLKYMDGYIAQVWTGTSRVPVYFNGLMKERVFENAFLEYGTIWSMTAPTHRSVYFLTDPIEDGVRTWEDYKKNYEATFTAELLYPTVNKFEVMPWPNRIYLGKFKPNEQSAPEPINPQFATQMQIMVNSLQHMPVTSNLVSGSHGISVLIGNSIMFQRFPKHQGYDDPQLSNFYGMVMPLVKRGVPVQVTHMENLGFTETLKGTKVLIMSYANLKPNNAAVHLQLAKWVKNGGMLIYCGKDDDPFQQVSEWWNNGGMHFKTPSQHLFKQLGINPINGREEYTFGKGKVFVLRENPKQIVMQANGDEHFLKLVENAYNTGKGIPLAYKNSFVLNRGPYIVAAAMDESHNNDPLLLKGHFIDLFNTELPVVTSKTIPAGTQALLYNLDKISNKQPSVLAGASRVSDESITIDTYSFVTKSPDNTKNVLRIRLPRKPKEIKATNINQQNVAVENNWDAGSQTLLLKYENQSSGVKVKLTY